MLGKFASPIAVALAVAVVLTAGYVLGEIVTGRVDRVLSGTEDSLSLRATATLFVLATYVVVAHLYLRRWTGEHLAALRVSFGNAITYEQSVPASIGVGILGATTFIVLFIIIPNFVTGFQVISFQLIAATISGMVFGWLAGRFLLCMVTDSLRMSKLARALPDLDLLDLRPLSPFVQQGLRSALLTVIVLTLTSHLYIAPGNAVIASSTFLLIWSGLTLVAFTLPVRGIRDQIRKEKQSQLAQVRAEIREAKEQVIDRRDGGACPRLSALLDMEIRLERVPVWPYDASSWLKLGLYMLLGLGSWLGAAAVERLLNSLF